MVVMVIIRYHGIYWADNTRLPWLTLVTIYFPCCMHGYYGDYNHGYHHYYVVTMVTSGYHGDCMLLVVYHLPSWYKGNQYFIR